MGLHGNGWNNPRPGQIPPHLNVVRFGTEQMQTEKLAGDHGYHEDREWFDSCYHSSRNDDRCHCL